MSFFIQFTEVKVHKVLEVNTCYAEWLIPECCIYIHIILCIDKK